MTSVGDGRTGQIAAVAGPWTPGETVTTGSSGASVTAGPSGETAMTGSPALTASPVAPVGAGQPGWPAHPVPPYPVVEPDRITRLVTWLQARLPRWAAPLAALGCIAGAVGYTIWADPTNSAPDAPPTCFLKLTTGLDCPGCGGTRAAWYLLHGDLPAAARHHLLFVFAVPFLLYLYVAWAGRLVFGWRLPQLEITPKAIGIFLAVWGVFSVLRNLPWAPFDTFYV